MKALVLVPTLIATSLLMSSPGRAEDTYAMNHPRIHEVNSRLRTQAARIDHALAKGTLTSQQATTLRADDGAIKSAEQTDKSLDNGHITKADKHALNQELNTVSKAIGGVSHPRIHEVDARLTTQEARINRDAVKGTLTPTQAAAFSADDANIKSQEMTEAELNGGHITRAEKRGLNEEVGAMSHQIGSATGHTGAGRGSHK